MMPDDSLRLLVVNDVHLSDRAPRWRTDTYADDIFTKLHWVLNYACDRANVVAFTGDVFHNPNPRNVSHALLQRLLKLLSEHPGAAGMEAVLIVPGNHDLGAAGWAGVDRQPLGSLDVVPNVHLLAADEFIDSRGLRIVGVGWDYHMTAETIWAAVHRPPVDVLLMHAPLAVEPNPHYETVLCAELAGIARVVFAGHIHEPLAGSGVRTVGDTMFVNYGALSRGSIAMADLAREPAIARLDMDAKQFSVLPVTVPHRPFTEVFRFDQAQADRQKSETIERFVRSLGSFAHTGTGPEQILAYVRNLTQNDPQLAALAEEILYAV